MNVYAKFRCAPLRNKKALGIFGPLEKKWLQEEEQLEWLFGPGFRIQKRYGLQKIRVLVKPDLLRFSLEMCGAIKYSVFPPSSGSQKLFQMCIAGFNTRCKDDATAD